MSKLRFFRYFHSNRASRNGQWYGRQVGTGDLCFTYMQKQLRCRCLEDSARGNNQKRMALPRAEQIEGCARKHAAESLTLSSV